MSTRKKIEEFKQKVKLAGMIATMGTMTLSSCTPNTNSKDSDKDKIETVEKTKSQYDNPYQKALYEGTTRDIENLIAQRTGFDKGIYYDAIKLSKYTEFELLFTSGLRNDLETVELDTEALLTTAITSLKNREKDMIENKPDSQEKWKDAKSIVSFVARNYCATENKDASYKEFVNIYINSFKNNEKNSESFNYLKDVDAGIVYAIKLEKITLENAEENTVYQSFRESIEEHDVNKLKNSLANGGRQYINSADHDRAGVPLYDAIDKLNMLYVYQKGIDSVKNNPNFDDGMRNLLLNHVVSYGNQEDKLAKDIQSSKKIIEMLVQNGADISLLPKYVLEYDKEHHPESYKFLMETVQKNNMIKNKTSERGR